MSYLNTYLFQEKLSKRNRLRHEKAYNRIKSIKRDLELMITGELKRIYLLKQFLRAVGGIMN